MTAESKDLESLVLEKIQFGNDLINITEKYKNIEGIQKLKRKIQQELNFLKKIHKENSIKNEHLQCSNLTHISALIKTLENFIDQSISVNKVFQLNDRKITVDIVSDSGLTWIKVIARNPKSLNQVYLGDSSYGVRTVFDQAEEFLQCANLNPCCFQTPKIIFLFVNGIMKNLSKKLQELGINVQGTILENSNEASPDESKIIQLSLNDISAIQKVNLDVSAMLAYVSSVTNGSAGTYEFSIPVLAQQAQWEQLKPQKPILENFFKGKKLYCCTTARDSFVNIVNIVGGPNEQIRAKELLKQLIVLSDDAVSEDDDDNEIFQHIQFTSDKILPIGGKVKERSLIIFTFGDRIHAVTVTANEGFIRAAKQQGINFVVFIHESRALTEQKELKKGIKR